MTAVVASLPVPGSPPVGVDVGVVAMGAVGTWVARAVRVGGAALVVAP